MDSLVFCSSDNVCRYHLLAEISNFPSPFCFFITFFSFCLLISMPFSFFTSVLSPYFSVYVAVSLFISFLLCFSPLHPFTVSVSPTCLCVQWRPALSSCKCGCPLLIERTVTNSTVRRGSVSEIARYVPVVLRAKTRASVTVEAHSWALGSHHGTAEHAISWQVSCLLGQNYVVWKTGQEFTLECRTIRIGSWTS